VHIFRCLTLWSCILTIGACAQEPLDASATHEVPTEHQEAALRGENRLAFNRLAFNRLAFNRLAFNRLAFNRLAFNRLAFNSLDGLEDTEGGQELLTYVARCALDDGDILVAEYDNPDTGASETLEFPGLLGLAPAWEERALTASEGRWVSACLIAHVNAYGVSVQISLRASGRIDADEQEAFEFPVYEGTFFGSVFEDETLATYACLGGDPRIANAHASQRALRVCTDPGEDCEVSSLGYCRDVCDTYEPSAGWSGCWVGDQRYEETVSTFLYNDVAGCRQSCGNNDFLCNLLCPDSDQDPADDSYAGNRILSCDGIPGACNMNCPGGACSLDADYGDGPVNASFSDGAVGELTCRNTASCRATCTGEDTSCALDCTQGGNCRITQCVDGADCLIDCTDASHPSCNIAHCEGQKQYCADGVVVCNRACP